MTDEVNTNRRDFIKGAGVGAAVLSSLGVSVAEAAVPPPAKWDAETDVLVLGYGGAGAKHRDQRRGRRRGTC